MQHKISRLYCTLAPARKALQHLRQTVLMRISLIRPNVCLYCQPPLLPRHHVTRAVLQLWSLQVSNATHVTKQETGQQGSGKVMGQQEGAAPGRLCFFFASLFVFVQLHEAATSCLQLGLTSQCCLL